MKCLLESADKCWSSLPTLPAVEVSKEKKLAIVVSLVALAAISALILTFAASAAFGAAFGLSALAFVAITSKAGIIVTGIVTAVALVASALALLCILKAKTTNPGNGETLPP